MQGTLKGCLLLLFLVQAAAWPLGVVAPVAAIESTPSLFKLLPGRWVGEGILGLKDSPPEKVKCRATYFTGETAAELKQTIRCATSGGSIEVKSFIKEDDAGKLSGHWQETSRNLSGDLSGDVTPQGFRIEVRGGDLAANMAVIVRNDRQMVEIQFIDSAMIGLTLVMQRS